MLGGSCDVHRSGRGTEQPRDRLVDPCVVRSHRRRWAEHDDVGIEPLRLGEDLGCGIADHGLDKRAIRRDRGQAAPTRRDRRARTRSHRSGGAFRTGHVHEHQLSAGSGQERSDGGNGLVADVVAEDRHEHGSLRVRRLHWSLLRGPAMLRPAQANGPPASPTQPSSAAMVMQSEKHLRGIGRFPAVLQRQRPRAPSTTRLSHFSRQPDWFTERIHAWR